MIPVGKYLYITTRRRVMKQRIVLSCLFLLIFVSGVSASEEGPMAVSPGIKGGVAVVDQSCPTFSWSEVQWTEMYRVKVFQALEDKVLFYEEMEALGYPVISKDIQGRALSWTPSQAERLVNGQAYVWYVQAVNDQGIGVWSEGRKFRVEEAVRLVGVEEKLRESLNGFGLSEEEINRVLYDVTSGVKEVDVKGSGLTPPGQFAIQGYEEGPNTFFGKNAGGISHGNYNSFFGSNAGYRTSGNDNTFIGYKAGLWNTSGSDNTFVGKIAGLANIEGSYNTFIGNEAGNSSKGDFNTFVGSGAGKWTKEANSNTFIGFNAGSWNLDGNNNLFVGRSAGLQNTYGSYNTFLGYAAGLNNFDVSESVFVGYKAGYLNTTGSSNTFIGFLAGYYNAYGNYNTFLGYRAGNKNHDGNNNTFLGYSAGTTNAGGNYNTFLGYYAGRENTSGNSNTFIGEKAGHSNETGYNNTFIGRMAGYKNEAGFNNTYIGYLAGRDAFFGRFNTYIGRAAGFGNLLGVNNTFIGFQAGYNGMGGAYNTFIGNRAGQNNNGSNNVFLGHLAGFNASGSNRLYIDSSDTSTPLIYGEFDTDKVRINSYLGVGMTPTNPIDVVGGAYCNGSAWVDGSSRELKENIIDLTTGDALDTLEGLNPVRFNYKTNKEDESLGFIAEDVPELVASKDRKGMSAMDVVAVLTKVVQEQQRTIGELQKEIDELKKKK
jgi:hypothetical protein